MEVFLVYTSLHETAEDRWSNATSRHLGDDSALGRASGQSGRESEQRDAELRTMPYHDLPLAAGGRTRRRERIAGAPASGAATEAHAGAEVEGTAVDQRQGSAPVRIRLRIVDAADRGGTDRAAVRHQAGGDRGGTAVGRARYHAPKAAAPSLRARPRGDQTVDAADLFRTYAPEPNAEGQRFSSWTRQECARIKSWGALGACAGAHRRCPPAASAKA
jgi:hypothetical protein